MRWRASGFPSFYWLNNILLRVYVTLCPSSGDGPSGGFRLPAVADNAVMNMGVQVPARDLSSVLVDTVPEVERRTRGSRIFSAAENRRSGTPFHGTPDRARGLPILADADWFPSSLFLAVLIGMRSHLTEGFICVPLTVSGLDHPSPCLRAMRTLSSRKCLFKACAHFFARVFALPLPLSGRSPFRTLRIEPVLETRFMNVFSPSAGRSPPSAVACGTRCSRVP